MKAPSSQRNLAAVLTAALRGPDAFTLQVVFVGKVKPVELWLCEVLSDGIRACAGHDAPYALYPFSGMLSVSLDYNGVEPEADEEAPLDDLSTPSGPEEAPPDG